MNKLSSQSYKGTRDYYPDDKRLQNYIFAVWRQVAESFGYEEYSAPILEPLEVYAAKSGKELVNDQTYSFADRGGRVVAIRPEMTPSVCRMVAAQRQELAYPARLYSIANFMRYERPQRGREREFWQLNVDIFGDNGIGAEAEIITMASKIMDKFGADTSDYIIKINNRKLINFIMAEYFSLSSNQAILMTKLFDRKNKISSQDFTEQATEIFGDNAKEGIQKIDRLLQSKTLAELPPEIRETSGIREIQCLFTLLERAGISNLVFDVTLMRGLDYYTGMVFEVFDADPNNARSLFGGGRYDGLVGLFGVEPISAVGMAPGGTMIENFLDVHGLTPKLRSTTDVYVSVLGDTVSQAVELANKMRDKGLNVEVDNTGRKLDRQLKIVLKKAIPYVLFVGEDEVKSKLYTLRNMAESKEYKLSLTDIVRLIKE